MVAAVPVVTSPRGKRPGEKRAKTPWVPLRRAVVAGDVRMTARLGRCWQMLALAAEIDFLAEGRTVR